MLLSDTYQFHVPESSRAGTLVGRIQATDKDIGKNAEMYFTIISGDGMDMFDISTDKDTQEGVITVSKVTGLISRFQWKTQKKSNYEES